MVTIVRRHTTHTPDRPVFTILPDGDDAEPSITFEMLDSRARRIADLLLRHTESGERVLLLCRPGKEFIYSFYGCLYASVIAVPTYLPEPGQRTQGTDRLAGILEDCTPAVILSTDEIRSEIKNGIIEFPRWEHSVWLTLEAVEHETPSEWIPEPVPSATVALLQYTSGSTADPKGVIVTHGNLIHNIRLINRSLGLDESPVIVGWLPPYHDMGLVSMIVAPAILPGHAVLMPTIAFLQHPIRWLRAISEYGGTASAAPNFAFDLCATRISQQARRTVNLSSLAVVANGAEPIRPESMRRFADAFAASGFRPEAIVPMYGLAESTLMVSGTSSQSPWILRDFDTESLARGIVREVPEGSANCRTLVGCGSSHDLDVVIADPEHRTRCAPGTVGEIWVAGASVAAGYWGRTELSNETFGARLADSGQGPYLRTGDLGFQIDAGLFVVGRMKDVLIVAGRNHYPQDIELTVEGAHSAVRPGCAVAFAGRPDAPESVVVAAELRGTREQTPDLDQTRTAIRCAVMREHHLSIGEILLLPPGSIPKTPSGKPQRSALRGAYLSGVLTPHREERKQR
ncbi:fatty acyl-AMP ligase [Nocardia sp. NBC_01503]|uniref:fatty acyl-AMP ligase n=1 Tax=Nocardia sp. NBC_01503 TaxID=2975997 RepID=UPI002E7AE3CD|nr:fatty acyl-AMP ligase [Nocardia sp. NBC_01503]WTL30602.1 fatty acyl-AMP ligase [Nocardia sp. NBC_01503]